MDIGRQTQTARLRKRQHERAEVAMIWVAVAELLYRSNVLLPVPSRFVWTAIGFTLSFVSAEQVGLAETKRVVP